MRAYIDADILIWHLRGENKALSFLKRLARDSAYELWTGAMQRAEVVFFMESDEEELTLLFLAQFKTAPVDQKVVENAAALYREWNPSHGIDINDSILAATAMITGGQIFCLNKRHYPIPGLMVKKAW
jgi:predicted nucleic acid-binding protein